MNREQLIDYMKSALAETMAIDIDDIDENTSFFKLGVTSIQALKVINKMRRKLDVEINPAAIFEYKCISDLADYLMTLI
jgi:polyketide synthase PksL